MDIKEKLEILRNYYVATRQVGHTTLMKEGTDNYEREKLVLTYNKNHGAELGIKPQQVISWYNLNINGYSAALAIDNGTMQIMLEETLKYINELENDRRKLNKIKSII